MAKLQISGTTANVIWATLLGGPMSDSASAIALDGAGNVYITGSTDGQFPTTSGSFAPGGPSGVFVAKFNREGSKVIYSTYLPEVMGGILPNYRANAAGIAVDAAGSAYITGYTGFDQLFVTKLKPDGSARLYNTTLSGVNGAFGSAITVDAEGNAYVTGFTSSPDFPVTAGAFQTKLKGNPDAFVTKLDPAGNVIYATFLGGSGYDIAYTIQADAKDTPTWRAWLPRSISRPPPAHGKPSP